ncbi:hypothetical protein MKS88_003132 [Plasmodium brasilianum]|uniref:Uncharacterized protein n=2 Tax=Plasmodium (Plasmodium) TaxID=418103 RepID=A0A1A8VZU0_PLAMA|nr:conserved Plasmodium protein, unknown function [Plasmodium malariae]KAI4837717.1 hypothetical protein MKS88_003132 [Plasmodium brasilianum]SBS86127.1 conserved Plasmodium protein, unknown function [Plasmodium malariae]SCN44660.1 conserved Plasmodium protein, unknown function [Plasmodium malariae]
MEVKERRSSLNDREFYKYRNKKVIKTIDDINEFIKKFPRTNRELNTYIIKKDRGSDVSLFKSLIFYIFTQITSIVAVCLVIFCIGFLIGNHISSKSSIINSVNHNFYLANNIGAVLHKGMSTIPSKTDINNEKNLLKLDLIINIIFDYNNLFMGTLVSKVLLYYYPSNDIGLNANEFCFNTRKYMFGASNSGIPSKTLSSNKLHDVDVELFKNFIKEESLIFLNYSIKKKDNNTKITFINDVLFEHLHAYPIGGSDITISPGIMQGINSINALVSINHTITDENLYEMLLNDCKKGRIYIQLYFGSNQIRTILFRFQAKIGVFLPFRVPCQVRSNIKIENSEFRMSVIKNYHVQKAAIKNINFFIN